MLQYLKRIYNKSQKDYYAFLSGCLENNTKKFVITTNPESIMMAENDEMLDKMLLDESVDLVPDGIAVIKACQMLGVDVTERITGVDIADFLISELNHQKKSIYLFGAKPEVVETFVNKIKADYPDVQIAGYSDGYVKDRDAVFDEIVNAAPDVCLVALGIPHQEKLIYRHIDRFEKGIFVGVGGSFDVLSGCKARAPQFFIKHNIEWLYRIAKEPSRLKRFYNSNVKFIFKIRKEKNHKVS
ncbi:MAG: WecB/TagA/CpsF family glycosyltransferase [Ruminococcaceae bacterium]|nr:WecB/TagA/CpsF family glycosyltransferase [Oscillospiraceae bacterium]